MVEEFVLSRVVDGVEVGRCVLSRVELKLVKDGIFYAKEKDYLLRRKQAYALLGRKLWELMG